MIYSRMHAEPLKFRGAIVSLLVATTLLISGCDLFGEDPSSVDPTPEGIYIANQGNFSDANGTITYYDPGTGSVSHNIIPNIGSIIQSMTVRGNRGYIMSNSANRIDVFDLEQQQRVAQITDVKSPRYMAFSSDTTAYVTNQSPGTVTIIHLPDNSKQNILKVGNNPEGVTESADRVYVANHDFGAGSSVSVINAATQTVRDPIDVDCDGPRNLVTDRQREVWVFCTGNTVYDENWNVTDQTNGAVRVIDPVSDEVIAAFSVDGQISTAGPGHDVFFAAQQETIYAVVDQERVIRFDTGDNSGPTTVPIAEGDPIGTLAYVPGEDMLFVGRTPGFASPGIIEQYNEGDSTVVDEFEAGIAPAYMALDTGDPLIVL